MVIESDNEVPYFSFNSMVAAVVVVVVVIEGSTDGDCTSIRFFCRK